MAGDSDFETDDEMTHIPAMILVDEGDVDETIAGLEDEGVIILRHRANILLALIPVDWTPGGTRSSDGAGNIRISKTRSHKPAMDVARSFNNADFIAQGRGLPQPYTGKGVVVGICDIGMDSRHPNFLDSELKECRIRKVVQYTELKGLREEFNTPQEIYDWHTDTSEEWHATHVAGIAAGAYKDSGFYSLAPDADIVFTASQLSDVGLLAGVEDIIEYANEVGKPAVINLSMGNYVGPHDGSSLFTRYLDLCAEDAIICISSGNTGDGGSPCSMSVDFTADAPVMKVGPNDWGGKDYTGEVELWSRDSTPFKFTFYWANNTSDANDIDIYPTLLAADGDEVTWRISADPSDPDFDSTFAEYFYEGYVTATSGVSYLNGRYCTRLEFSLKSDYLHPGAAWAEFWASMKIEGEPGSHVDIFCGGGSFLRKAKSYRAPDNSQCVSDLATGFKTISVGMTINKDMDTSESNLVPGKGYLHGEVGYLSSYGTLIDGRVLPLTCAPGGNVVSSQSSAFLDAHSDQTAYNRGSASYDGKTYYWASNTGTSMSCPYAVGTIATWLQAYPSLTSEEAQNIVLNTNKTDNPYPENPRHGRGWLNPYKGLLDVLSLSALHVTAVDSPSAILRLTGRELQIANPSDRQLQLTVYNAAGMAVESSAVTGNLVSYPLHHLSGGVYIISVSDSERFAQTLKVVL